MKLNLFKIDWQNRKLYKRLFGPYSFSSCPCGCTDHPDFGFMFFLFGVSVKFTHAG